MITCLAALLLSCASKPAPWPISQSLIANQSGCTPCQLVAALFSANTTWVPPRSAPATYCTSGIGADRVDVAFAKGVDAARALARAAGAAARTRRDVPALRTQPRDPAGALALRAPPPRHTPPPHPPAH